MIFQWVSPKNTTVATAIGNSFGLRLSGGATRFAHNRLVRAASAALLLELPGVRWLGLATATGAAAVNAKRFFVDFDIEILAFSSAAKAPPPPKPHFGHQASGAGSRSS
jgi:hypothetical protein